MRRIAVLAVVFVFGCAPFSVERRPDDGELASRELRLRAEAFLRDELSAVGAEASGERRASGFQCLVGDLFRAGHAVAVVAFVDPLKAGDEEWTRTCGIAFFSRRSGRWELRNLFADDGESFMCEVLRLQDFSGDETPEVLLLQGQGVTGNECWSMYRYGAAGDALVLSAESLGLPEWDGREVATFWKSGACGFENTREGWVWDGPRLRRAWVSSQGFVPDSFLVGSDGERAVEVGYAEFDASGRETYGWKSIGNVPSFRNLVGETLPQKLVADISVRWRRRLVRIEPDLAKLEEAGIRMEFLNLVSEELYRRPEVFDPDSRIEASNGRSLRLGDLARIDVSTTMAGADEWQKSSTTRFEVKAGKR